MSRQRWKRWTLAALAVAACAGSAGVLAWGSRAAMRVQPLTPAEQGVKAAVRSLWQQEDQAAAQGRAAGLLGLFDLSTSDGRVSLKHALARLNFVQAWARVRGVGWQRPEVSVRTTRIRFGGGDPPAAVDVTAVVSEAWTYTYRGTPLSATFGLGREHYIRLARTANGWRIEHDWFTDPLDQDTRIPGPAVPASSAASAPGPARGPGLGPSAQAQRAAAETPAGGGNGGGGYNRQGALAYADRFCGAAPGCGNGGRYNARFFDYNGDGGDCTNFVSQVLSLGGGLRRSSDWTFDARTGEGTATWVKSGVLAGYLVGRGWARVVARGTYPTVAAATSALQTGDIIAYMEKGEIVHLAVVTGSDPRGYTLVNSHTADRHHVPWDIGWDRGAIFVLLHMQNAAAVRAPALAPDWLAVGGAGCGSPAAAL